MANCDACNDLKSNSAGFASNGVTTAVCNSLKNDTGFSTSNSHNDCTDLDLANDCLIGNLDDELDAYDYCDIKDFLHVFVANTYQVIKAMICAICGIWTNIHQLWDEINALKARVKALEDRMTAVENRVTAIEDYIEDTLKPWINGVNSWRTTINNWKTEVDTWRGQINSWKSQIDTWKNDTVPATYLTKSDAASTYLTKTDASNTYLTKTDGATKTYVTQQVNNNNTNILNPKFHTIRCYLEYLTAQGSAPTSYELRAYNDGGQAINGFRIARGVTVRSGGVPLELRVIGTTARLNGSLTFGGKMPADYRNGGTSSEVEWLDFYDGGTEITNTAGARSYKGNTPSGNLFLYEFQVNPCDFGFAGLYATNLFSADGGDFQCRISMFRSGDKYPYDYGWGPNGEGDGLTYSPQDTSKVLIQVRLVNVRTWGITRTEGNVSPNGVVMVRPCPSKWSCGDISNW